MRKTACPCSLCAKIKMSSSALPRSQPLLGNTEAQWPIGYGVGLRIKRSSVRIRPWPLGWVLGQGSLLPLSQGEAFTLASISYLAILIKYILAKKKKKKKKKPVDIHALCIMTSLNQLLLIQPTTNAKWSLNRRDNNPSNDTRRCW